MVESLGRGYKPYLIASVVVLVGSLALLITSVFIGFVYHSDTSQPLWIVLLGAASVLGIGLGFGGFFVLMMIAGWRSFREGRRVQIIPPDHVTKESRAPVK